MLSLEAYVPCQGAYTQHNTLPEQFLFSKIHFHHRITVSYCLTTGKENQNPKPQQYLTERNNSTRLQYTIHEVTNNKIASYNQH